MKNFTHILNDDPRSRYLYLEGRVAEVNASVLEKFKKKAESTEKNKEALRVTEAKNFALNQMPLLSNSIMKEIGKHFNRPKKIEDTDTVENLEKAVKESVFKVLENGVARSKWGINYLKTVESVETMEDKAILTLKDTDQALQNITALKEQYMRQAQVLLDRKDKTNKTKGILKWKKEVENTSDYYRFERGHNIAVNILSDMEKQFGSQKEKAETLFTENKDFVAEMFAALPPDQKYQFIDYVKMEMAGTNVLDRAAPWANQLVANMKYAQRVEIFQALNLDPTRTIAQIENKKNQYNQIEQDLEARRDILDQHLSVISDGKLKYLKTSLKGYKKDESFDPSKGSAFKSFVRDMGDYLERSGDIGINNVFDGYPSGEILNDHERMAAYLRFLYDHRVTLVKDRMPKALKAKFLAYIEFLEEVDAVDEIEGHSKTFIAQKDIVLDRYEQSKNLPVLLDIDSIEEINEDVYELIGTFLGATKNEKNRYEKLKQSDSDLSDSEIKRLDNWYSEIDKVLRLLESLRSSWEKSQKEFTKERQTLELKVQQSEEAVLIIENDKKVLEKEIEDIEDNVITKDEERLEKIESAIFDLDEKEKKDGTLAISDRKKYNDLLRKHRSVEKLIDKHQNTLLKKNEQLLIISGKEAKANFELTKAKSEITKFEGSIDSFDITKTKTHFAEIMASLESEIEDIKAETYKEKTSGVSTNAQMKRYIMEQSAKLNNQRHQERLKSLQKATFDTLQKLPMGTGIRMIEYVEFLHGREMTAESALLRPKSRLYNAVLLEKTEDAVVFYSGNRLIVIQQAKASGKVEVLSLNAPTGFDPSSPIPPDYFPETANNIGELTTITV